MPSNLPPAMDALMKRHEKCTVSSCTELEAIVATLRAVAEWTATNQVFINEAVLSQWADAIEGGTP